MGRGSGRPHPRRASAFPASGVAEPASTHHAAGKRDQTNAADWSSVSNVRWPDRSERTIRVAGTRAGACGRTRTGGVPPSAAGPGRRIDASPLQVGRHAGLPAFRPGRSLPASGRRARPLLAGALCTGPMAHRGPPLREAMASMAAKRRRSDRVHALSRAASASATRRISTAAAVPATCHAPCSEFQNTWRIAPTWAHRPAWSPTRVASSIDLGLKSFAVVSDGSQLESPKPGASPAADLRRLREPRCLRLCSRCRCLGLGQPHAVPQA